MHKSIISSFLGYFSPINAYPEELLHQLQHRNMMHARLKKMAILIHIFNPTEQKNYQMEKKAKTTLFGK